MSSYTLRQLGAMRASLEGVVERLKTDIDQHDLASARCSEQLTVTVADLADVCEAARRLSTKDAPAPQVNLEQPARVEEPPAVKKPKESKQVVAEAPPK